MGSTLGKTKVEIETGSLADGDSIAAYLTDAAGTLLTSTLVGAKQSLDVLESASHVDSSAYATGVDYLSGMGVVDNAGNWVPFTLNAAGELPVSATVDMAGDYAEDSPASSGDVGLFTLLVRQDTLAISTTTDGDYGAFKSNAKGELYVKDTDVLAQLILIKGDTASIATSSSTTASNTTTIVTNTGTIATNTGTTATNTGTIATTLSALSKAEDAVASSGDQGIQALAVRKDSQASNAANGDYTSLQTWSEGSLKVVDVSNGSLLQQRVSVANTATQLPAASLANRKTLMVQNAGAASIWVGSATVTASGATAGIEIAKSSFMELEVGPDVAVYAITAAGSVNANVLEMG